jgi:hypothetical protein
LKQAFEGKVGIMQIPSNITREDFIKAIRLINIYGINHHKKERKWYVEYNNKRYPCNYLMFLANSFSNRNLINTANLDSKEIREYLRGKKFIVKPI